VFSPLDWPTTPGSYPEVIVRTPRERKENAVGRNGPPTFFTTVQLVLVGRVEATTESDAEQALEALSLQLESALLTNDQFIVGNDIQQFPSVEVSMEVNSEGATHIGETVITLYVEIPQTFDPVIDAAGNAIASLTEVDVQITDAASGEVLATETISLTGA
jgi:hypothetical protein